MAPPVEASPQEVRSPGLRPQLLCWTANVHSGNRSHQVKQDVRITFLFEGRSIHLPADGLLLGQWHASSLDLFLGDSRLVLGLWGGQVQRGGDYGFKS